MCERHDNDLFLRLVDYVAMRLVREKKAQVYFLAVAKIAMLWKSGTSLPGTAPGKLGRRIFGELIMREISLCARMGIIGIRAVAVAMPRRPRHPNPHYQLVFPANLDRRIQLPDVQFEY